MLRQLPGVELGETPKVPRFQCSDMHDREAPATEQQGKLPLCLCSARVSASSMGQNSLLGVVVLTLVKSATVRKLILTTDLL